jgi:hypothetical protein
MRQLLLGAAFVVALAAAMAVGQGNPPKPETSGTQAASTNRITGRCHCGYIAYEADGAGARCDDCACQGCRRASGSLKTQYVVVSPAALKITAGQPSEFRAKSAAECDKAGVWQSCPKCGAPVFWKSNKGDQIDIFAGTLDDTRVYRPKR